MLRVAAVVCLLLILPLTGVVGGVTTQDDWADKCTNAETVSTGTYSGDLTPGDVDILAVKRSDGDSLNLNFDIRGSKITFTVMNKRVVNALFNAGTKDQFKKAVNDPGGAPRNANEPRHLMGLDYSLSSGFSKVSEEPLSYGWMGNDGILAYDPLRQVASNSPFYGPIWQSEPGKVSTTIFFNTDDTLCLRVQTTSQQEAGSWQLTISEDTPTPTSTPTQASTSTQQTSSGQTATSQETPQDSDGDGVPDSEDYAPNDPEVQEKSDLQGSSSTSFPGFGVVVTIVAIVGLLLVVVREP